jgi:hypothetical protein
MRQGNEKDTRESGFTRTTELSANRRMEHASSLMQELRPTSQPCLLCLSCLNDWFEARCGGAKIDENRAEAWILRTCLCHPASSYGDMHGPTSCTKLLNGHFGVENRARWPRVECIRRGETAAEELVSPEYIWPVRFRSYSWHRNYATSRTRTFACEASPASK